MAPDNRGSSVAKCTELSLCGAPNRGHRLQGVSQCHWVDGALMRDLLAFTGCKPTD